MNNSNLSNQNLNLIKLSKSMRHHKASCELVKDLISMISSMPDYHILKNERFNDLVCYLCNLIENGDYKASKGFKLNKKDVAVSVVVQLFPELDSEEGKKRISSAIEFCIDQKLVKKIPRTQLAFNKCSQFFLKHLYQFMIIYNVIKIH